MLKTFTKTWILLYVLGAIFQVHAQSYESYLTRPDIFSVKPQLHSDLPKSWEALKRGHVETVAQILELYPDEEIYFLARDSELLYDYARLMTKNDPMTASRLHLLNVSRVNMRASNIKDYLIQEGISDSHLQKGRKVLFVDTGFSGTIPDTLKSNFSQEFHSQFKTHLLSSLNPEHPSTRVFLMSLNPAAADLNPGDMQGTILEYERLPRFTDRSDRFEKIGDRWSPMSVSSASGVDGVVNKEIARKYQSDLAAFAESKESQTLFEQRRQSYKKLKLAGDDLNKLENVVKELIQESGKSPDPYMKALIKDFLETKSKITNRAITPFPKYGINFLASENPQSAGQKVQIIAKYPQWKLVLKDPETGIKNLLTEKKFTTLGAISDAIYDEEFFRILTKALGEANPPSPSHIDLVEALIKGGKADREVAQYILSQPHWQGHPDLEEALLKNSNSKSDLYAPRNQEKTSIEIIPVNCEKNVLRKFLDKFKILGK